MLVNSISYWLPSYLQCTNMGPSGTPSTSLTLSLKCNRAPALSGTPLSGQAVKWKCLKSFCSLVRFWKNIIMKTYDICLISMHRQISKILFWACRLKRAKTLYICSKVILTKTFNLFFLQCESFKFREFKILEFIWTWKNIFVYTRY